MSRASAGMAASYGMVIENPAELSAGTRPNHDGSKAQRVSAISSSKLEWPAIEVSRQLWYHLWTLYLFTRSDFKSIVVPQSLFAIACAISTAPLVGNGPMTGTEVAVQIPYVVGWTWVHLLVENIENQRGENSIVEDSLNKSWRPLPSGRLTRCQAQTWLMYAVCVALTASTALGALKPSMLLLIHIWLYNGCKWESSKYAVWIRNAFNAGGIMSFSWGALSVLASQQWEPWLSLDLLLGRSSYLEPRAYAWILIEGAIVMTTVHAQDMPDVEGDSIRGRATLPLLYGERWARWSLAMMTMVWSILCPLWWRSNYTSLAMLPVSVGSILATLTVLQLGRRVDELVWLLWGVWVGSLYLLPLACHIE